MRRGALLLLVGCLGKPPRPTGDAAIEVPDAPPCAMPSIADTFDDAAASPCGAGFAGGGAPIERAGGVLRISPTADVVSDASCTWNGFAFENAGAFVQVRRTLRTGGTYTILQVEMGDQAVGLSAVDEAELSLFDTADGNALASAPYVQAEMQWWRLRPANDRIAGEYSADGVTWTTLGVTVVTPPPTAAVEISFNAGTFNEIGTPGTAEFDNFNVCP